MSTAPTATSALPAKPAPTDWIEAYRPIRSELHALGFLVPHHSHLVWPYPEAFPVLIKYVLDDPIEPGGVDTWAGRKLGWPEARGLAGPVLVEALRRLPDVGGRCDVARALAVAATKAELPALEQLVVDPALGYDRIMLLPALNRLGGKRVRPLVRALLDDEDPWVRYEAAASLGRMKDAQSLEKIRTLLETETDPERHRVLKVAVRQLEKVASQ